MQHFKVVKCNRRESADSEAEKIFFLCPKKQIPVDCKNCQTVPGSKIVSFSHLLLRGLEIVC